MRFRFVNTLGSVGVMITLSPLSFPGRVISRWLTARAQARQILREQWAKFAYVPAGYDPTPPQLAKLAQLRMRVLSTDDPVPGFLTEKK